MSGLGNTLIHMLLSRILLVFFLFPLFAQAANPGAQDADQRDLEALQKAQDQVRAQYEALNRLNPMSPKFGADTSSGAVAALDPAQLPKSLKMVLEFGKDPRFQSFARRSMLLLEDREFHEAAIQVSKNKDLHWLYIGLLVGALVYLVLRHKVLAATDRWWVRIFLRLGMYLLFFLIQGLITYAVLGQPFLNMLLAIKRIFFG